METPLRLLLVEDSEDDMILLLHTLRQGNYSPICQRVQSMPSMVSALELQPWDLVISDYFLPGFSALEALQLLQSRNLDLPFIVVSGAIGEDTAVAIMKAGAHDYLLKDNLTRLVPAVERELREAEMRRDKRQAEEDLRQTYEGLEMLVQQRTAELETANQTLQQLAAIVESSDDAIISTTLDWMVLSWNAGAEQMYGYSAAEAKGQNLNNLIQPDNAEALQLSFSAQQTSIDHQHAVHQRKDGRLIDTFLTVSPVKNAAGETTGISMITRDISERRAIEKIKDEFVSIVSHELRTPLTSIRGSLGLLLTGKLGELTNEAKRFLNIAVNNTDRLIRLINDILDLERLESGKINLALQRCDLADLMFQATEVMQSMAHKANIVLHNSPVSVQLLVDSDRILQTLTNLLSNAIKFSDANSSVFLNARLIEGSEDCTENAQPYQPSHVLITVEDQGRGIPTDKLESVFERFQQVDASDSRQKGGTGLGLAICRSIIQQHGGKIWVESTQGKGSTFFLTLPIIERKEEPLDVVAELPEQPMLTHRVLIVEDNRDLAHILLRMFKEHGIEAFHAQTSAEAIQLCQRITPDLIILDYILPEESGFMVVDWLRRSGHLNQIPLIVYSAKDLDEEERSRLQLESTWFITKSRTAPEDLEKQVIALLEQLPDKS